MERDNGLLERIQSDLLLQSFSSVSNLESFDYPDSQIWEVWRWLEERWRQEEKEDDGFQGYIASKILLTQPIQDKDLIDQLFWRSRDRFSGGIEEVILSNPRLCVLDKDLWITKFRESGYNVVIGDEGKISLRFFYLSDGPRFLDVFSRFKAGITYSTKASILPSSRRSLGYRLYLEGEVEIDKIKMIDGGRILSGCKTCSMSFEESGLNIVRRIGVWRNI